MLTDSSASIKQILFQEMFLSFENFVTRGLPRREGDKDLRDLQNKIIYYKRQVLNIYNLPLDFFNFPYLS